MKSSDPYGTFGPSQILQKGGSINSIMSVLNDGIELLLSLDPGPVERYPVPHDEIVPSVVILMEDDATLTAP
jgi:hypothetical protein